MDFRVFLRQIPTKMQLSLQKCPLEIPGLTDVELFKNYFMQGRSSKIVQKNVFPIFGHAEENFDQKLGNLLNNVVLT